MQWLNYHHLLYFWVVAREGSITRACDILHLAQPTISAQLHQLEKQVGSKLFEPKGRRLALTDRGRTVYEYADEIFTLGRELQEVLAGRKTDRPLRFAVGVPDSMPKLVTYRILEPALRMPEPVQLHCAEGKIDKLYAAMAEHELDMLISDIPAGPDIRVKAFSHLLGESEIAAFGIQQLAAKYKRHFPESLADAPLLLPTRNMLMRRLLDQWFDAHSIRPNIAVEMEDGALMKTFGQAGHGIFFGSAVIENEICRQYDVWTLGRLEGVKQRFFAITPERRTKHPAIVAIAKEAKKTFFGEST